VTAARATAAGAEAVPAAETGAGAVDAAVGRLLELTDHVVPIAVRAVCDLGIADLLAAGDRPVADLAAATGAHPATLHRVLRTLAGRGVFAEVEPGVFGLTPLAQPLRSDHPLSLRDTYTLLESDVRAWARLPLALRTGGPAFDLANGKGYWEHLADHPDESRRVDRWMRSVNRLHLRTVVPAYPWHELTTLVDLGGGDGSFLAGLLPRHPGLRAVLLDRPYVVAAADDVLRAAGVADRCEVIAGSFFDPLPAGADGYLLKTVLPGFADDDATRLLTRVREAMRPDSRLVLLEAILPPGDAFDVAKLFDIHTLVLTGGAHRSRVELERLLAGCGLRLDRTIPTATLTVVEAFRRP
jgi:hypothetical protein